MLLLVLGVAALATAAYFLAEAATLPARQRAVALRRAATYGRFRFAQRDERDQFRDRVLVPMRNRLAAGVLRLNPRMTVEAVSAKLLAAGMNRRVTATGFLAFKAGTAVSGIVLGALTGGAMAGAAGAMLFGLCFAGLGFIGPDFVVSSRARRRREQIKAELPDALDLLMVSVEAGLGFDGAVGKLTEHMEGPLAEEFALTLNEMRIGESRPETASTLPRCPPSRGQSSRATSSA
jgi:tight adherence protein C